MNLIEQIRIDFFHHIQRLLAITNDKVPPNFSFLLNVDEKKKNFGDLTSNIALLLAQQAQESPHNVATKIAQNFSHANIEKIEVAGPGFLNFFLTQATFIELIQQLRTKKEHFFVLASDKPRYNFSDEFISANPTGPLHFGHGRSGIIGDVLGNVLRFLGHRVTKEFYINDAGAQIRKLGISLKIRCQQILGDNITMIQDGYHGDYVTAIAQSCIKQHGNSILEMDEQFFCNYAKNKLLDQIKETVTLYGITFDVWFSENSLHADGSIDRAVAALKEKGYVYEEEGALWFLSTKFGDDKDRVLKKSSGEWTYAAVDVAYLLHKAKRGFDRLIMVLGQDHHSYATRLQNIRSALVPDTITLDIILYQLVRMKKDGKVVQMSKRTGSIITLNEVIEAVGTDVARFFYLNRKADAQLEFDLDLARKKTAENPVYYVQYAYVRTSSIITKASEHTELCKNFTTEDLTHLNADDLFLIKKIISLKSILESISYHFQTHLLTYYVIELADLFHKYYSKNRVIDPESPAQSRARLVVITLLRNTIALVLELLGITRPKRM